MKELMRGIKIATEPINQHSCAHNDRAAISNAGQRAGGIVRSTLVMFYGSWKGTSEKKWGLLFKCAHVGLVQIKMVVTVIRGKKNCWRLSWQDQSSDFPLRCRGSMGLWADQHLVRRIPPCKQVEAKGQSTLQAGGSFDSTAWKKKSFKNKLSSRWDQKTVPPLPSVNQCLWIMKQKRTSRHVWL